MNVGIRTTQKNMVGSTSKKHTVGRVLVGLVSLILLAVLLSVSYVFAVSPEPIRSPQLEHSHFRMQIIVDGQAVDFSEDQFQIEYIPNQCTGDLAAEPIHFHDARDQIVHIHWANITGGMVLKNYGWNYIGGTPDSLGYRLDDLNNIKTVPIHGAVLPAIDDTTNIFIYSGDESAYVKKDFKDFLVTDLETFFGVESNFPAQATATDGESDGDALIRINNLLGNVVIFAQDEEPTEQEIASRFNNLVELSDSTCGG